MKGLTGGVKYKNIKNKPQKCGRWLFLHSRFPNFSGRGPRNPLVKGIQQLNPQNLSSLTTAAKGKKKKANHNRKFPSGLTETHDVDLYLSGL